MKTLLKIVRSQMPHEFRLGIEALSSPVDFNAATNVIIRGVLPNELHLNAHSIYYNNGTIDCAEIGQWITDNGWGHPADAPLALLKFDLFILGTTHVYEFVGKSNFNRLSRQDSYIIDVPDDQSKISTAW